MINQGESNTKEISMTENKEDSEQRVEDGDTGADRGSTVSAAASALASIGAGAGTTLPKSPAPGPAAQAYAALKFADSEGSSTGSNQQNTGSRKAPPKTDGSNETGTKIPKSTRRKHAPKKQKTTSSKAKACSNTTNANSNANACSAEERWEDM